MYKVEILQKKDTFLDDLLIFLFEKSIEFRRDFSIDNILNEDAPPHQKFDFLLNKKIHLDNVFGSTFQSYYRSNNDIYAISHTITDLLFENNCIYGMVKPSDYGEVIDFSKGFLLPVYYRPDKNSDSKIATFDIDFSISDNAA
jgi:hypothetical protein